MSGARRLTMAQAMLQFCAINTWSGMESSAVLGVFGIFGHGMVAGLGLALIIQRPNPVLPMPNEQGMVHTATAFAKETVCKR